MNVSLVYGLMAFVLMVVFCVDMLYGFELFPSALLVAGAAVTVYAVMACCT